MPCNGTGGCGSGGETRRQQSHDSRVDSNGLQATGILQNPHFLARDVFFLLLKSVELDWELGQRDESGVRAIM
jgi:hypothetical protein